jgi:NTP pyrophosphatase (non-canonical NTP hydrolase)
MDIDQYQQEASRTLIPDPGFPLGSNNLMTVWMSLGLTGEAGEVADHVKKGIFHRHGVDLVKLREELGDVLWYVASLCTLQGLDMADVMAQNIEKLKRRYPDGYSSQASINRSE